MRGRVVLSDPRVPVWSESDRETIKRGLSALGLNDADHMVRYFQPLLVAARIYQERYESYHDAPIKAMGPTGTLVQARTCIERIWHRYAPGSPTREAFRAVTMPPKLDDAYDCINYLVHFVNGVYNNETGTWKWS